MDSKQQVAEKNPYASLPLNRLAATYCKYASARRFFARLLASGSFEQPANRVFQRTVRLIPRNLQNVVLVPPVPLPMKAISDEVKNTSSPLLRVNRDNKSGCLPIAQTAAACARDNCYP